MTGRMRDVIGWLWLPGLFFVAVMALFWRWWWPGMAHWVFAYGDFTEQYYPMRVFVAAQWRLGQVPFWDPYAYGGYPAVGASLYAPYYPLGLWHILFPPPLPLRALEFDALLHLVLAGYFTFLFVRQRTRDAWAGVIAGMAFALGGYLTSYPLLQLGILYTAVWLPLVLFLMEWALERKGWLAMGLPGAALGVSILAGHPQTFLYIAYVAFPYLVFRLWQTKRGWRDGLAAVGMTGVVAVGVGAAQWLPVYDLMGRSPRAHLGFDELAHGFLPTELWGLLRPNPKEWSPLYVGWPALALTLASLLFARRSDVAFWGSVAGIALLLSLGENGGLYPLFYRYAPGFALFRNQERAAFVVSFALALLAGLGLAGVRAWLRERLAPPRAVLLLSLLLVGTLFVDLFHANANGILAPMPPKGYFASNAITERIRAVSLPDWRMSSEGLLPGDGNAGQVYGLRDVAGNSPLHLAAFDHFLETVPEVRWLPMLNVHHLVTRRQLTHGGVQERARVGDVRLYEVALGAVPLWITHAVQLVESQKGAMQATAQLDLDVRATVVLEESPEIAPRPLAQTDPSEFARLLHFAAPRIEAEAELAQPGVLVFSEIHDPGWRVWVDGQRAKPLRAYGLLRAVALPAGHHTILWRYQPLWAWLGLAISLLTIGGGCLSIFARLQVQRT